MCGLKDHDCRARMQARQGRVRGNKTTEEPNNRISIRHRNIIDTLQSGT